jgi:hypothetical protein
MIRKKMIKTFFEYKNIFKSIINMEDIKTVSDAFNYQSSKCENDCITKIREQKLCEDIQKFIKDRTIKIDSITKNIINKIEDEYKNKFVSFNQKGGRTSSYDFEIKFDNGQLINTELKVFKNTNKLPQLSDIYLSSNSEIIKNQFKIFCIRWLCVLEQIKIKFNIIEPLPSIDELSECLCKTTSTNLFLQKIKSMYKSNIKNKNEIMVLAKKYISKYLEDNLKNINNQEIETIYKNKIGCKDIIIIYNQKTQNIIIRKKEQINIELKDIKLQKCKDKKNNIGLLCSFNYMKNNETTEKKSIIRLRWKNNSGIYGIA